VRFSWEPVDIDSRAARLQVAHGIRTDPVLGKVLTKAVKQILLKRHYKYPLIESAIISPTVSPSLFSGPSTYLAFPPPGRLSATSSCWPTAHGASYDTTALMAPRPTLAVPARAARPSHTGTSV